MTSLVKTRFCHRNEMLSYDIIEKECDLSFHVIYYLCFCAFSVQGYADHKKL